MTTLDATINARDLSKFPRPVVKVLTEAINQHGVKYRNQDGSHIRLYDGNRNTIPCKVSATRHAEDTMRYLLPWLEQHVPSWSQREVTTESIETLAAAIGTSLTNRPRSKPVTEREKPMIKEKETFPCDFDDVCEFVAKSRSGLRMHIAGHTGEKKLHAAKGVETHRLRKSQESTVIQKALEALAELHGFKVVDKDFDPIGSKAEIKRLARERDDLRARLDLLEEAFRGTK